MRFRLKMEKANNLGSGKLVSGQVINYQNPLSCPSCKIYSRFKGRGGEN
jgi:hypothetical protein